MNFTNLGQIVKLKPLNLLVDNRFLKSAPLLSLSMIQSTRLNGKLILETL